jgi:hypothetical protein
MAAVGMVAGKAIGVPSLHALAASLVDDETNTVLLPQLFHFRHRRCPIRDTDGVTEAVLKVGRRIGKYQYRSQLCARLDVAFGSRLCENSEGKFSRGTFVSNTLNRKRTAPAGAAERRKERIQFCSPTTRARFHTA